MSHHEQASIHAVEFAKQRAGAINILFLGILCPFMALPIIGPMIIEKGLADTHESMTDGGHGH